MQVSLANSMLIKSSTPDAVKQVMAAIKKVIADRVKVGDTSLSDLLAS